jgi:hypothetical protein
LIDACAQNGSEATWFPVLTNSFQALHATDLTDQFYLRKGFVVEPELNASDIVSLATSVLTRQLTEQVISAILTLRIPADKANFIYGSLEILRKQGVSQVCINR